MTKQEYIKSLLRCSDNKDRIKTVSDLYGAEITGVISKIISFSDNADFIADERRVLSYNEIIKASTTYGVDFKEKGIIPFVDAYDNDLIVYIIAENVWAKYNISDDIIFKKKDNIEDIL